MDHITITEAERKYSIPASRLRTAIKRGQIVAVMKKGKYHISVESLNAKVAEKTLIEKDESGRRVSVTKTKDLIVKKRVHEEFDTTSAAECYISMMKHYLKTNTI